MQNTNFYVFFELNLHIDTAGSRNGGGVNCSSSRQLCHSFPTVLSNFRDSKIQAENYLEHSASVNRHAISVVSKCGYLHNLHSPHHQTERKQDSNRKPQSQCICPLSSKALGHFQLLPRIYKAGQSIILILIIHLFKKPSHLPNH